MPKIKLRILNRAEVLVKCQNGEEIRLVGLTHAQYCLAATVAEKLKMTLPDFIRATTLGDVNVEIPGQNDRFGEPWPATLPVDLESIDQETMRFIERQAAFQKLSATEYIRSLIFQTLAKTERQSIVDPEDGSILCRKRDFSARFCVADPLPGEEQPAPATA
jgi:hypothetical protein